jgi:hypothetical protein
MKSGSAALNSWHESSSAARVMAGRRREAFRVVGTACLTMLSRMAQNKRSAVPLMRPKLSCGCRRSHKIYFPSVLRSPGGKLQVRGLTDYMRSINTDMDVALVSHFLSLYVCSLSVGVCVPPLWSPSACIHHPDPRAP